MCAKARIAYALGVTDSTTSPATWGWRFALLLGAALAVVLGALLWGTSGLPLEAALDTLAGGGDATARSILFEVRLPRVLAALGVGSALALAGVLLQALFRNPLADPYVLGVSGGAAVGALFAMLVGAGALAVRVGAVGGALALVSTVWLLARDGGAARLLLTGVVLASACGAVVAVILALAEGSQLRGMIFWLAGDLGWAASPWPGIVAALLAVAAAVVLARPLNVLASGERRAASVGLDVGPWRTLVFVASAGLTALAVVTAGTIGFVGLVTPHAVRLAFRTSDHRIVAPAAALAGGALVVAADLLARIAFAPRQLPVGALLALVGTPVFLALLRERAVSERSDPR